jgi:hypothetical protein
MTVYCLFLYRYTSILVQLTPVKSVSLNLYCKKYNCRSCAKKTPKNSNIYLTMGDNSWNMQFNSYNYMFLYLNFQWNRLNKTFRFLKRLSYWNFTTAYFKSYLPCSYKISSRIVSSKTYCVLQMWWGKNLACIKCNQCLFYDNQQIFVYHF